MVYKGRKNIEPLVISKEAHQVLLGSLLGDAHLKRRGIYGDGIFQEEHCLKQMDYLRWKNSFLNFKEKDYDSIYEFLEGWFSYANHADTYNLRHKITDTVEANFQGATSLLQIDRLIKYAERGEC